MAALGLKVAVTFLAAVILTVQGPLRLEHAPLQPPKVEPLAGVAVRVTLPVKLALQADPHSIPSGALVTTPLPLPAGVMVSR